jgi:hypothetical protein
VGSHRFLRHAAEELHPLYDALKKAIRGGDMNGLIEQLRAERSAYLKRGKQAELRDKSGTRNF